MPKKRVYELAKELGLENKDLIAHLEKIGITVKSHSSSLEDSEVERIKGELLAREPRQIVEERIKTTVIRRRAIRTPMEEPPVEEVPVKEALAEKAEPSATAKKAVKQEEAFLATAAKGEEGKKEIPLKPAVHEVAAEKPKKPVIVAVKPPVFARHKITRAETTKEIPPKAPLKPGERIVGPPAEKTIKREFEKPKKKGKGPVEVFIEEEKEVPRRKILEKKIDKKLRKQDDDREVIFSRRRDEKKAAPVKMQKTEITVPKAIKRRIKIGDTISTGELAKRMGVKVSEVINKLIAVGVMATIN